MGWFRVSDPTADVSMLRVELMKAQMRIDELQYALMEMKEENDVLKGRIQWYLDVAEINASADAMWNALEILRGQR